jgi:hypothetical protein
MDFPQDLVASPAQQRIAYLGAKFFRVIAVACFT